MTAHDELDALLQRVARQDRRAFKDLYDRTAPRLNAIALRMLGRVDLAEEVLQETFLTIWDKAGRYDPALGVAQAWITTILRRRAIDRLRASPWLPRDLPEAETVPAIVSAIPESLSLRHCLQKLDRATLHAIILSYMYGMTHRELHDRTGIPLGTLKSRLRRGLLALRKCLET